MSPTGCARFPTLASCPRQGIMVPPPGVTFHPDHIAYSWWKSRLPNGVATLPRVWVRPDLHRHRVRSSVGCSPYMSYLNPELVLMTKPLLNSADISAGWPRIMPIPMHPQTDCPSPTKRLDPRGELLGTPDTSWEGLAPPTSPVTAERSTN